MDHRKWQPYEKNIIIGNLRLQLQVGICAFSVERLFAAKANTMRPIDNDCLMPATLNKYEDHLGPCANNQYETRY